MMMKLAMWLTCAALLFFGARMTWFMGEGAHYLMHKGAVDAILGFLMLTFASVPFLVCALLALWMGCEVYDVVDHLYDDGEES